MNKLKLNKLVLVFIAACSFALTSNSTNAQAVNENDLEAAYCSAGLPYSSKELKKVRSIEKRILKIYDRLQKSTVDLGVPDTGASGVIISEDGYILTAAHVIKALGDKDSEVRLYDGTIVTAACLGKNINADYGLMKIKDKGKWTYSELGTSSDLVKDEICLLLGHPEVYDPKRSAVVRLGFYKGITPNGYLETSCIMMPGDSGGPLFNLDGKVIGVCSYIKDEGLGGNYYPAVDQIKENWDRLEFGEVFYNERMEENNDLIEAASGESSFAIEGGKNQLENILKEGSREVSKSVVKIQSKIDHVKTEVYGTIINPKGYIVSKSSRIGVDSLICELSAGVFLEAKVIDRDKKNDLVVIKIETNQELPYISLSEDIEIKVGQLLGTVGVGGDIFHAGIVSVNTREVVNYDKGYLGINFDSSKPIIRKVVEGKPADAGGLIAGDTFISFDDTPINSRQDVYKFLKSSKPEQSVRIKFLRDEKTMDLDIVLGKVVKEKTTYQKEHPAYRTKESKRKDGFPNVFTHDMSLLLNECGTPVVNLGGEVIGINIARKNRPSAYAIPLKDVRLSVEKIFNSTGIDI